MKWLKIGQLAKETGLSIETIRYYEKEGLIRKPERNESGYRIYPEDIVKQILFIRYAKGVGFSLKDITELLELHEKRDEKTCHDVKEVVDAKLVTVIEKIRELERMKNALKSLSDSCCGGHDSAENCSIIKTFNEHLNLEEK